MSVFLLIDLFFYMFAFGVLFSLFRICMKHICYPSRQIEYPTIPIEIRVDTENREPPVSPIIVIQSTKFNKIDRNDNTSYENCAICIEDYEENDDIFILEKCNHMFHKECIIEWMTSSGNTSCPVCNA